MGKTYFVSGIDTDCGKTIAAGLVFKFLRNTSVNAITQKLIQTGCNGISEDIDTHRQLAESGLFEEDIDGTTCPYVLKHPASPHLAAALEQIELSIEKIDNATQTLESKYDVVLLEGAGGLYVPIKPGYMIIDHIIKNEYPLILVTSAKVGSINHTMMSLELCKARNIKVHALIYNYFPSVDDLVINDSKKVFEQYLQTNMPDTKLYEIPRVDDLKFANIGFKGICEI